MVTDYEINIAKKIVSQVMALFLVKLLKFILKIIMLYYQIFLINSPFMAINLISITHAIHMSPVGFLYEEHP